MSIRPGFFNLPPMDSIKFNRSSTSNPFVYPHSPLLDEVGDKLKNEWLDDQLKSVYLSLNEEQRYKVDFQEMLWHITEDNVDEVVKNISTFMKLYPCLVKYWLPRNLFRVLIPCVPSPLSNKFLTALSSQISIEAPTIMELSERSFLHKCRAANGFDFNNKELREILTRDDEEALREYMARFGCCRKNYFTVCVSAAYIGALKCFKYSLLSFEGADGYDEIGDDDTKIVVAAIIGKNLDIFHIVEQKFSFSFEYCVYLKTALKYHNWYVVKWIQQNVNESEYWSVCENNPFKEPVFHYSEIMIYYNFEKLRPTFLASRPDIVASLPEDVGKMVMCKDNLYEETMKWFRQGIFATRTLEGVSDVDD